jgi:hypothetical protein
MHFEGHEPVAYRKHFFGRLDAVIPHLHSLSLDSVASRYLDCLCWVMRICYQFPKLGVVYGVKRLIGCNDPSSKKIFEAILIPCSLQIVNVTYGPR